MSKDKGLKDAKNWFLPKIGPVKPKKFFSFSVDVRKSTKKTDKIFDTIFVFGSVAYRGNGGKIVIKGFRSREMMCNWILSSGRSGMMGITPFLDFTIGALFRENVWGIDRVFFGEKKILKFAKRVIRKITDENGKTRSSSTIDLIDSSNHFDGNITEMGYMLGETFVECKDKYCTKDLQRSSNNKAEILLRFFEMQQNFYNSLGCVFGRTTASTAMDLYQRKYFKHEWANRKLEQHILSAFKRSYYGGRIENFVQGKIGKFNVADFNSFYGSVMRETAIPLLSSSLVIRKTIPEAGNGIAQVQLEHPEMFYPILPYKSYQFGKTFYPVGEWEGVYTLTELRYFLEMGGKIKKILRVMAYGCEDYIFYDYVNDLYKMRLESRDPHFKNTCKNLMNSLYGKFAEGNDLQEIGPGYLAGEDGWKTWQGGYAERKTKLEPANYVNNIWSSIITSSARVKLHKALEKYDAMYCYTDSVFTKKLVHETDKIGELGLKMKANSGIIMGANRCQIVKDNGISINKIGTIPSKISNEGLAKKYGFWAPSTFKKSIGMGIDPTSIIKQEKTLNSQYPKRFFSHGKSRPWDVREIENGNIKIEYENPLLLIELQSLESRLIAQDIIKKEE